MSKVVVYAPAERAPPISPLPPYLLCGAYINTYLIRGPHFFLLCNWLFHQLAMAGYTIYILHREKKDKEKCK
jgi:hypothetical protein